MVRVVGSLQAASLSETECKALRTTEWSCLAGLDEASFRANCGKANWLACTSAKNFLVAAWRVREAVVGRVKIQGSALLMEPSPRTYAAEVAKARAQEKERELQVRKQEHSSSASNQSGASNGNQAVKKRTKPSSN